MYLAELTGRDVRIAVIDSGVHASHPHVGGAIVVAAHDDGGVRWLPGCLEGVVPVRADGSLDRDAYEVRVVDDRRVLVTAPYPRDIPGVPRDKNVHGISFAVANASGFVARALEAAPGADIAQVF